MSYSLQNTDEKGHIQTYKSYKITSYRTPQSQNTRNVIITTFLLFVFHTYVHDMSVKKEVSVEYTPRPKTIPVLLLHLVSGPLMAIVLLDSCLVLLLDPANETTACENLICQ